MNVNAVKTHYDAYTPHYVTSHGPIIQAAQHDNFEHILVQALKLLNLDKEDTLLDCGSGIGYPARFFSDHAKCKVYGLNISTKQLEISAIFENENCKFIEADFNELEKLEIQPTKVCFLESFCHSENPQSLYVKLYNALCPGGVLLIKDWLKQNKHYSAAHLGAVETFYSARFYAAHDHLKWAFDSGFELCSVEKINLKNPSDLTWEFLKLVKDFPHELGDVRINNTFIPAFLKFMKPKESTNAAEN